MIIRPVSVVVFVVAALAFVVAHAGEREPTNEPESVKLEAMYRELAETDAKQERECREKLAYWRRQSNIAANVIELLEQHCALIALDRQNNEKLATIWLRYGRNARVLRLLKDDASPAATSVRAELEAEQRATRQLKQKMDAQLLESLRNPDPEERRLLHPTPAEVEEDNRRAAEDAIRKVEEQRREDARRARSR